MPNQVVLDWWQLILLAIAPSVVGSAATLVAVYMQHQLTRESVSEGEKRSNRRGIEAEQRQGRRDYRRERVKPILDYLERVRDYVGHSATVEILNFVDEQFDAEKDELAKKHGFDMKDVEEVYWAERSASPLIMTSFADLMRALFAAVRMAPTDEIRNAIIATLPELSRNNTDTEAVRSLSDAIESYLANF